MSEESYVTNTQSQVMMTNDILVNGLLLLVLSVMGYSVRNSFDYDKQAVLIANPYVKHFIIISMIYFFISYRTSPVNPLIMLVNTVIIWLIFVIYTSLSATFIIIGIVLLVLYYVIMTYDNYYKAYAPNMLTKLDTYRNIVLFCFVVNTIAGIGNNMWFDSVTN